MLDADFAIASVTPGVVATLIPQHNTPAGTSRVSRIDVFTRSAGGPGWQVGRPLIVRIQ